MGHANSNGNFVNSVEELLASPKVREMFGMAEEIVRLENSGRERGRKKWPPNGWDSSYTVLYEWEDRITASVPRSMRIVILDSYPGRVRVQSLDESTGEWSGVASTLAVAEELARLITVMRNSGFKEVTP